MGKLPIHLLVKIPHYDWIAHLVLYGLMYHLLFKDHNSGLLGSTAMKITLAVIILEEISQLFLTSRTFSFMDIFMGFSGIFLFKLGNDFALRKPIQPASG